MKTPLFSVVFSAFSNNINELDELDQQHLDVWDA